mmetsp:Transcript_17117/g.43899  ORF Transcript_17117/g.43899 Transcript_17117/m.43899 type:complete len:221 (-) Transcript_17117:327-989(-)
MAASSGTRGSNWFFPATSSPSLQAHTILLLVFGYLEANLGGGLACTAFMTMLARLILAVSPSSSKSWKPSRRVPKPSAKGRMSSCRATVSSSSSTLPRLECISTGRAMGSSPCAFATWQRLFHASRMIAAISAYSPESMRQILIRSNTLLPAGMGGSALSLAMSSTNSLGTSAAMASSTNAWVPKVSASAVPALSPPLEERNSRCEARVETQTGVPPPAS